MNRRWSKKHSHCITCGTTEKPHASRGNCRSCDQRLRGPAQQRAWRAKNKDKTKAYKKRFYAAHPGIAAKEKAKWRQIPGNREREREYNRKWVKDHKNTKYLSNLKEWLKRNYNLTIEDYLFLLAQQDGVCAICKTRCSTGKRLAVDHEHDTGFVRGLLCNYCNRGLGMFRDNIGYMKSAIDYVESNYPQQGRYFYT